MNIMFESIGKRDLMGVYEITNEDKNIRDSIN